MSQFDWPIAKKKRLKLWRLPQNRRFYGKMECLPPLAHLNRWGGGGLCELCRGICLWQIFILLWFLWEKKLGKYVFGYKLCFNQQILYDHFFVKWTKERHLSAVSICKWKGGAMGKEVLKSPYEFQTWSNYLLKEEGKRERERERERERDMFHGILSTKTCEMRGWIGRLFSPFWTFRLTRSLWCIHIWS